MGDWTFFSNHAHVLFVISKYDQITAREIAAKVDITERFVLKILKELNEGGYIKVHKEGRNNSYHVVSEKKLRHKIESHVQLEKLIEFINSGEPAT